LFGAGERGVLKGVTTPVDVAEAEEKWDADDEKARERREGVRRAGAEARYRQREQIIVCVVIGVVVLEGA